MPTEVLALGIVGFGSMGRLHAQQLGYLPNVKISAIVDTQERNRDDARALYSQSGVEIFEDVDQALKATDIRAWVVASSTATHIEVAEKLLNRQCTILLEKPIAATFDEAERIRSLVDANSSNLMMGHILLWHREFRAVQDALSLVGRIHTISASRQRGRDHRLRYPGETPFTLTMVHDLYSVFALMSGAQPYSLSAQQREHEAGGVDLALAEITWRTPEEVVAFFHANFLLPDGAPEGGAIDELQVVGEKGVIRLSYESGYLTVLTPGQTRRVEIPRPSGAGVASFFDDALRSELESFVNVVRNEEKVPVGARYDDACQIQKWIEGFMKSVEIGVTHQC